MMTDKNEDKDRSAQSRLAAILQKVVDEQDKANGLVRVRIQLPRDYVPCTFCGGGSANYDRGCMACYSERQAKIKELDAEYKRQFPDGPKPFFSTNLDTPEGIASARRVIGIEAIEKAFGPGGDGVKEIVANAEREKKIHESEVDHVVTKNPSPTGIHE